MVDRENRALFVLRGAMVSHCSPAPKLGKRLVAVVESSWDLILHSFPDQQVIESVKQVEQVT